MVIKRTINKNIRFWIFFQIWKKFGYKPSYSCLSKILKNGDSVLMSIGSGARFHWPYSLLLLLPHILWSMASFGFFFFLGWIYLLLMSINDVADGCTILSRSSGLVWLILFFAYFFIPGCPFVAYEYPCRWGLMFHAGFSWSMITGKCSLFQYEPRCV